MKSFNYREQMVQDVREWMYENRPEKEEDSWKCFDYDSVYDGCWSDDSVTGNASGSYTFNRYDARDNFTSDPDSEEYISGMVDDGFCSYEQVGKWIAEGNWEALDVCIRCYLLADAVTEVFEKLF